MKVSIPTAGVGGIDDFVGYSRHGARCDRGVAAGAAYGNDR